MSIQVYPRLGELLREKNLTVVDLERQIEQQYGLTPNVKTLYRLASGERIQRADLEIAGAAAFVLGVGLNELFLVRSSAGPSESSAATDLTPEQSRRLSELFATKLARELSDDELSELDGLVSAYGKRMHERAVREYAQKHGLTIPQAREVMEKDLHEAETWWARVQASPDMRASLRKQAREFRPRRGASRE